ncbi:MFS transporter [Ferroglobus placidus]|nr:MFS transporter [Ferroglobus placidus]
MNGVHKDFLILGMLFAVTSFDTLLLGFAIPKIIVLYSLSKAQAGLLGTILMIGVGIGAIILGALSDVLGRKNIIIFSVSLFSTSTGLLGFAENFLSLAILLFFSGFGLGGGLTLSIAYLPEIIRDKPLEKYMCYFESFWGIGALFVVSTSRILLERPLKELFFVGAFPFLLLPIFFKLSEIRAEKSTISGNIRELLSKYWKITILLWVIWFCGVYTYYGIFLWLPEVMSSIAGFKAGYSLLIPVYGIQIISPLFLSLIIRDDNTEKLLFLYSLAAAIFTLLSISASDFLVLGMISTSFFSIGGWVLFILSTQKSYPQKMRGIGVGSAASVGRIGGIVAPYFTGLLLDIYGIFVAFTAISLMFVVIAILSFPLLKIRKEVRAH